MQPNIVPPSSASPSMVQRFGGFFRLGFLAILALLLLVPVTMVQSLVHERERRSRDVVREVSEKWGQEQVLGALRLDVPCTRLVKDAKGRVSEETVWMHAWPETLDVVGELKSEVRQRGIFRVPLYKTGLDLGGEFKLPDPAALGLRDVTPRWAEARLELDAGDVQSLIQTPKLTVNGMALELSPTGDARRVEKEEAPSSSESARLTATARNGSSPSLRLGTDLKLTGAQAGQVVSFMLQLSLRGQGSLSLHPLARSTSVKLTSDWSSPSFEGRFLPTKHNPLPGGKGFAAEWNVSSLNLDVPMRWTGAQSLESIPVLGIRMVDPVDGYDCTNRSLKYAFLFVVLTFLAFFLFETFLETSLHPVQYLLVGLANCLFYLLTLAISEHIGFDLAYWIAAGGTTLLVGGYAASALSGWLRAGLLALGTLGLYGFLFTLLKAEDWSLLMGSCGLFLILSFTMWITRKVDWARMRSLAAPSTPEGL